MVSKTIELLKKKKRYLPSPTFHSQKSQRCQPFQRLRCVSRISLPCEVARIRIYSQHCWDITIIIIIGLKYTSRGIVSPTFRFLPTCFPQTSFLMRLWRKPRTVLGVTNCWSRCSQKITSVTIGIYQRLLVEIDNCFLTQKTKEKGQIHNWWWLPLLKAMGLSALNAASNTRIMTFICSTWMITISRCPKIAIREKGSR